MIRKKTLILSLACCALLAAGCGKNLSAEGALDSTEMTSSAATAAEEGGKVQAGENEEKAMEKSPEENLDDVETGADKQTSESDKTAAADDTSESDKTGVADKSSESAEAETGSRTDESSDTNYDTSKQYEAKVLTDQEEIIGGTYTADETDESVLEASGSVQAAVTGAVLQKVSGDAGSQDDSSFRGVNAGVRVYGDAEVTLKDCIISADAENATGVFAYENGVINIADSKINVTGGGAGGVQVAGGGTLYGTDLTVSSASKAAIRSDRGGGTMVLDGGTYVSTGTNGCPAIYSTADITVKNAECSSEKSRAVIIEGKNSVTLENTTLTGNDQSTKEGSVKANVLLYQSASGDASEGTGTFTMTGGSMTSLSGAMFYCTNTAGIINLENAELELSEDGSLLIVSEGRWGHDGSNGGVCVLNAADQTLEGSVTVDEISSLEFNLSDSTYTGAINTDGEAGEVSVTLDENSTWTLTGDSYISEFSGDIANVVSNGYELYVDGESIL